MKIAVMQPYFFPYIGYFQLINAVDKFVFYDDVNFIKGGWINRNKILINGEAKYFGVLMKGASSNKNIYDVKADIKANKKTLKTISQSYGKAPYYNNIFPLIENFFKSLEEDMPISEVAGMSVEMVAQYLGLKQKFEYSSKVYPDTKGLDKADRLIEISKINNAKTYVNAFGGKELYSKEYFLNQGIKLKFINNEIKNYKQFSNNFVPYLSIVDVLMFNSPEEIRKMLDDYTLL